MSKSTDSPSKRGYKVRNGTYRHIMVAEKAFGGPLPTGAIVHHFDGNCSNDSNTNLVICPSQKYHFLLHRRQRALEAGFPANWLRCHICKSYGAPKDMLIYESSGSSQHRSCQVVVNRIRRASTTRTEAAQ